MASATTFTPQVLGETEKALNAILIRELTASDLTEHQWIAMQLTTAGGGTVAHEQLVGRLAGALKRGTSDAETRVDELVTAGLLTYVDDHGDGLVRVTETGRQVHGRIRATVADITGRLWGDLPQDDLDVTGRTLATILERANAEFEPGSRAHER
jgi:DNA-binding MarR family transcriptional regulator